MKVGRGFSESVRAEESSMRRISKFAIVIAPFLLAHAAAWASAGYVLTTLATFNGPDGNAPEAAPIADAAGNLFGTTFRGGMNDGGTIFEVPAGSHTVTTLARFDGSDGVNPYDDLIADAAGNFYGTAIAGGASGDGTIFELTAQTHSLITLASFNGANGAAPLAGLIADANGNLYGTTSLGGRDNDGVVFELTAGTHTLTALASFDGLDGAQPGFGTLLADSAGNFFGTTSLGGANNLGTVYELAAGSHTFTTLASFDGANGSNPNGGLIVDPEGNLYGTTEGLGSGLNGNGTAFELAAGTHTVITLANFNLANGTNPQAGLISDAAGDLFGTLVNGGANHDGAVFELAAGTHAFSTVVDFNGADGLFPYGGLAAGPGGSLFGMTEKGGPDNFGTLYELSPVVPEPEILGVICLAAGALLGRQRSNSKHSGRLEGVKKGLSPPRQPPTACSGKSCFS
jgi:uncharacterized repeat protein (TIGR03803 family)